MPAASPSEVFFGNLPSDLAEQDFVLFANSIKVKALDTRIESVPGYPCTGYASYSSMKEATRAVALLRSELSAQKRFKDCYCFALPQAAVEPRPSISKGHHPAVQSEKPKREGSTKKQFHDTPSTSTKPRTGGSKPKAFVQHKPSNSPKTASRMSTITADTDSERRVSISGLAYGVTAPKLEALLQQSKATGPITDIFIPIPFRGLAFATLSSAGMAQATIASLDGTMYNGKRINLTIAANEVYHNPSIVRSALGGAGGSGASGTAPPYTAGSNSNNDSSPAVTEPREALRRAEVVMDSATQTIAAAARTLAVESPSSADILSVAVRSCQAVQDMLKSVVKTLPDTTTN